MGAWHRRINNNAEVSVVAFTKLFMIALIGAILVLAPIADCWSFFENESDAPKLHLESGTIDLTSTEQFKLDDYIEHRINVHSTHFNVMRSSLPSFQIDHFISKPAQLLLQLKDLSQKKIVEEELGIKLNKFYLSEGVYAVRVSPHILDQKLSQPDSKLSEAVKGVWHYKSDYKTTLNLQNSAAQAYLPEATNEIEEKVRSALDHVFKRVKLNVLLHVHGEQETDELVLHWTTHLRALHGADNVHISKVSMNKLVVSASPSVAGSVLDFLKSQEEVHWIERNLPHQQLNKYGHSILQANSADPTNTPIWNRGLTGKSQIVGLGDTGIDWDNCFFNDPSFNSVPVNTINNAHRKIISYQTVTKDVDGVAVTTDTKDGVDGHGTHVAGSIAGSLYANAPNYTELSQWAGSAPDAKIFFTDLSSPSYGGLLIPDDLSDYFGPAYEAGARIHSSSWGCSTGVIFQCNYDCKCYWLIDFDTFKKGQRVSNTWCKENFGRDCCRFCNRYDTQAAEIDYFMHEHPDFLVVIAAGNDGASSSYGSVGAPATCKNCLSVGASQTANANFMETLQYTDFQQYLDLLGFTSTDQCCSFSYPKSPDTEALVKSLCCPSYMKQLYSNQKNYNHENIPAFSARGPTNDNRFKPEVVAPGYVVHSAHSDGSTATFQCGTQQPNGNNSAALISMMGTSMATPMTAGVVALVRQYFVDGFYPSGVPNANDSMSPSGALMKAMMIHSAKPLTGLAKDGNGVATSMTDTSYPNKYAGYGLINLSYGLRFNDSNFDLLVFDEIALDDGQTNKYCFEVTKPSEFKATLVWTDQPGNPSMYRAIINDLNLQVKRGLYIFRGNHQTDSVNTVEQVVISDAKVGEKFYMYVNGHNIPLGPQKYSLVVSGAFHTNCQVPSVVLSWGGLAAIIVCAIGIPAILILLAVGIYVGRRRWNRALALQAAESTLGVPDAGGNYARFSDQRPVYYYSSNLRAAVTQPSRHDAI